MSACPPWKTKLLEKDLKDVGSACRNDVEIFTSSLRDALDIPPENIFTLVDQDATYEGLQTGLKEFADKVPKGSRVIMLLNTHGELTNINSEDEPEKDEVLVLWTEDKPFTMLSALALKQWITASELRSMIDNVKADEIVIAIDACHSGAALPNILLNHGRNKGWQGREAVMASSTAEQYSHFTMSGSHGLFTRKLSKSIAHESTLQDAFNKASAETTAYINTDAYQKKCSELLWKNFHSREKCEQTPIINDPSDLLSEIKLNSPN